MANERRLTQAVVEVDILYTDGQRRLTQAVIEADIDTSDSQARLSSLILEADVEATDAQAQLLQLVVEVDILITTQIISGACAGVATVAGTLTFKTTLMPGRNRLQWLPHYRM